LGLAVFIAAASLQTTRLESGAIRGRSELAVSTLRWNPGLRVVFAGRGSTQVTTGDIDDAVVQIHRIQHLTFHAQPLQVLLCRVSRLAVGLHVYRVERVNGQDAAGVLTGRPSFTAETG